MQNTITLKEFVDLINSITALNSKSKKIILKNNGKILKTERLEQCDSYLRIKINPAAEMQFDNEKELDKECKKFLKDLKLPSYTLAGASKNFKQNICFIVDAQDNVVAWADNINVNVSVTFHNKAQTYTILNKAMHGECEYHEERDDRMKFIIFDSLESMLGN